MSSESHGGDRIELEPRLVGAYVNNHLAGAVGGSRRFERLADVLSATPVGPPLAEVARQVVEEREELGSIIDTLGFTSQNPVKQAGVWLGERVSRLLALPTQLRRNPAQTLLEVELLRSALMGKLGGWQTLHELADLLDLDADRMDELARRTLDQVAVVDEVHAYVRRRALAAARRA